jgi:hypothetical protein
LRERSILRRRWWWWNDRDASGDIYVNVDADGEQQFGQAADFDADYLDAKSNLRRKTPTAVSLGETQLAFLFVSMTREKSSRLPQRAILAIT